MCCARSTFERSSLALSPASCRFPSFLKRSISVVEMFPMANIKHLTWTQMSPTISTFLKSFRKMFWIRFTHGEVQHNLFLFAAFLEKSYFILTRNNPVALFCFFVCLCVCFRARPKFIIIFLYGGCKFCCLAE